MSRLLSIIIPAYNAERHLRQCLDSVLGQTYENIEIIVINDCSTDGTSDICNTYADRDKRVKVINQQENKGAGYARKTGVATANGEYIGWVDSDDWLNADAYERLISVLEERGADIVQCKYYLVYEDKLLQSRDTGEVIEYTNIEAVKKLLELDRLDTVYWCKVFKKSIFEGIEMSTLRSAEDSATMYKLFFAADKVVYYDKTFYHFRQHIGTLSSGMWSAEWVREMLNVDNEKIEYFRIRYPEIVVNCRQKIFTKYIAAFYTLKKSGEESEIFRREIAVQAANLYKEIKNSFAPRKRIFYFILLTSTKRNPVSMLLHAVIWIIYKRKGFRYSSALRYRQGEK